MSNSKLVSYTKIVKNYTPMTDKVNRKITIHHMAGDLSVETCANVFNGDREASSNYAIGSDGRIALYVEEKNRAWTSGSKENDSQAITIEVANNSGAPNWTISDKAMSSLINLCVDICNRNGIKELTYTGDKNGTLTLHRFYQNTVCPGPYIESKIPYIVSEVNKRLTPVTEELYRVRKSWEDSKSQIGAYKVLKNAKAVVDKTPGYKVYDSKGVQVYPIQTTTVTDTVPFMVRVKIKNLYIRKGPGTNYATNRFCPVGSYTIIETKESGGYTWGKLKSGAGWIALKFVERI